MSCLTLLTCPLKKKYTIANVSEDAASMSDDSGSYLEVNHLTPVNNVSRMPTSLGSSLKCCSVAVALIVSLSLNILVSVYLWKHAGSAHLDTVTQVPYSDGLITALNKDSVCTACSSLGIHPENFDLDFYELSVHHIYEGFYLCCMQNAQNLRRLVSLFTNRFLQHPPLSNSTIEKRSGAHLYIDSEALKSNPPILAWNKDYGHDSAYSSNDVVIDGNQIHITKPGLYHIYSFITFKTEQRRPRPDNVVHTVNRRNTQIPQLGSHVILIDKTTLPEVSERFMTSFLSATVRLRKDDQIFVRVSNLSYVYRFAPSNFFGLYFVGE